MEALWVLLHLVMSVDWVSRYALLYEFIGIVLVAILKPKEQSRPFFLLSVTSTARL